MTGYLIRRILGMIMLLFLLTLTGIVRLTAFALTREAVPEPLAWLGWHGWRVLVRQPAAAAREHAQ